MPNRLASEKSPYLLQHAANPVDWYPWGDEAFERARQFNTPIFLSIGYSTCHWCHVMEHESFESETIAAILNRDFVPIKVDREERPDVDRVYMTFVQATTGSGGWPMSVWLTPDLKPFHGGTYYPPDSRYGRPGFADILTEIARAWREQTDNVRRSAEQLTDRLRALSRSGAGGSVPGTDALSRAAGEFAAVFDARRGGFGDAPKFPRPSELFFLLREHARSGDARARDMVLRTLQAMASGGMRDHIGGGFHRYAVDADWRVPHFEKMLYDQAQLALAFLEAAQLTGDAAYAEVADETLAYVARDMTDADGGFYSAEDADSLPPARATLPGVRKTEGAFYLWSHDEVGGLLGSDADLVRARFGIEPGGNAPVDPHGEFVGGNLLYLARDLNDLAATFDAAPREVAARLEASRRLLFATRQGRPRPHLDDKVLTAWNGLMIAAFARGGRVLGRADHVRAAQRAAAFIRNRMWSAETHTLFRRYREGDAAIAGYADDYACLIWGVLELFQADGDPAWLTWAVELQRRQDELFWDETSGGWFSTTGTDATVLLRMKEDYDGAEPSASAVGAANLLLLAHLTGDARWHTRLERVFAAFGSRAQSMRRGMPMMLAALSAYHAGVQQLVIVGARSDERTSRLVGTAAAEYLPFAVTVVVEPGELQDALARVSPSLGAMRMIDGCPAAYVCRDFTCRAPTTDPEELQRALHS